MDMLQLEYFLEVARKGNMTSAANTLHVAQSSVSRSTFVRSSLYI
jgi:DNA-binding transcriptional LysR family regulator